MVKIPDTTFPQSGVTPDVVPGMTVIVDLLGDKRTIMEYILSPIKRAQTIAFREK
jgi:multidrug efflux pump subunit AcrA (membrane-fusion protein)